MRSLAKNTRKLLTRTIQQTALLEKRIRALEQALAEQEKDA